MNVSQIIIWGAFLLSLYMMVFWILTLIEERPRKKVNKLTEHPKVTIAIPAYNEEKNIAKSISSALELEYPRDKLEIIVVNDGSTDDTSETVKKFLKDNDNLILLEQTNKGKGAALNHALEKSHGDFFVCLDADSQIRQEVISSFVKQK